MKLINFTIIKLCICLITGILFSDVIQITIPQVFYLSACIIGILSIVFYFSKKQFHKTIWFGVSVYFTAACIGVITTNFHNEKYFNKHYSKFLTQDIKTENSITFRINEILKPGIYNDKYIIDILKIGTHSVSGKSLLNIERDSLLSKLEVDDILLTTKSFSELPESLNPNQFDYKAYLERQYIYHQINSEINSLFHISDDAHTLNGYANSIRKLVYNKLKSYHFKLDELAIINALILGQRQEISKTIYTNYTNAGAIHILAVSGLHVGILLLIFNTFLKPIEYFKHGKHIKVLVLIFLLWSYAILAGASASIIRASTMFSIVAIGMHLKRPSNIYNTLAISIFIILLFKPLFLFDVGFQLSYLAVFAIVSIQPLLYKLWTPKFWLTNKLWQVFTVTIAAQFGVIPISLFYFHQFPGLFWFSNIVIVPLLGIVLTSGILIIVLALFDILPQFFADCYGEIINLMNVFFSWISNQNQFLIEDISFNFFQVLASYLIIIALVKLYAHQNFKSLKIVFISIICLQLVSIIVKHKSNEDAFIIFHKSRNTIISQKQNTTIKVFHNLDTLSKYNPFNTYVVANFISNISEDSLQSVFTFKNKTILLVDSLGIYNIKSIKPDYILLQNSPKINLVRLIDSLNPREIIADGSNYKSYITRWEKTCKKRKLPFHHTGKKGAFILKE